MDDLGKRMRDCLAYAGCHGSFNSKFEVELNRQNAILASKVEPSSDRQGDLSISPNISQTHSPQRAQWLPNGLVLFCFHSRLSGFT